MKGNVLCTKAKKLNICACLVLVIYECLNFPYHTMIKMTFLKLELIPLFAGVPYDSSMQIDEYWHEYPMHYEMDY